MTSHSNNDHPSNDKPLSEEQTMFPYLLTLDSDVGLLEESETARADFTPNLTTTDLATTIVTTSSFTANTPVTDSTNTEGAQHADTTLNTLHKQLADAQKEITNLRHYIERNHINLQDHGIRMLTVENALRQLMPLHPSIQSTNSSIYNPTPRTTQSGTPTEKNTEIQVTNPKRNLGENPNTDFTLPQAKRAKAAHTDTTEYGTKTYKGHKPFCSRCNRHHDGPCILPCKRCKAYGHQVQDCKFPPKGTNSKALKVCFECENTGHFKANCPLLTTGGNNNKKKNTHAEFPTDNVSKTNLDPNNDAGTLLYDNQISMRHR